MNSIEKAAQMRDVASPHRIRNRIRNGITDLLTLSPTAALVVP